MSSSSQPVFFPTATDFRAWLTANHTHTPELWVGYYKKASGRPSITWPESVDQALCFGWIDGLRKSIDDVSYMIRFTPRRPRSIWSTVNQQRIEQLIELGQVQPAGLKVFTERAAERSSVYAYEQAEAATLDAEGEREFKANEPAWRYFQSRPPGYQRAAVWWVMSAKQATTRQRRLGQLVDHSARGETIPALTRPAKGSAG